MKRRVWLFRLQCSIITQQFDDSEPFHRIYMEEYKKSTWSSKGGNRGLLLTTWNEIFLWEKTLMCRHIRPFVPALSQRYMCALHTYRPHQVSYWYLANCEILLSIHLCRVQSQSSRNSQLMSSAIISKQLALTHTVSAVDRLVHTFTPVAQTHTHTHTASRRAQTRLEHILFHKLCT